MLPFLSLMDSSSGSWPSMEYQSTKANFTIAKKDTRVVVEEGNLIPYVMVKYYSE
jgi:hypothetical protein